MKKKDKIAIVAGKLDFPRALNSFAFLTRDFQVSVFLFEQEGVLKDLSGSFDLRVYKDVENMPGFLRGLEDDLAEYRLIICFESTRLYSFQALQAAKIHGAKLIVYSSETNPFQYIKYENIKSMQREIVNYASLFLAPNQRCFQQLAFYGDISEKFAVLAQPVERKRFYFGQDGHKRFRTILGLSDTDIVVLYFGDLNQEDKPEILIEALALLRIKDPKSVENVKILFVGRGEFEKKLKYLAFDSGFGGSIYFMHNDFDDLIDEIYKASNMIVCLASGDQTKISKFPFHIHEAMACGVVPIVPAGSVSNDLAGDACVSVENSNSTSLALALYDLISNQTLFLKIREKGLARVYETQNHSTIEVERRIVEIGGELIARSLSKGLLDEILSNLDPKDDTQKIDEIDRILSEDKLDRDARGHLLCVRGDLCFGLGNIEKSIASYESAISNNRKDPEPLIGLGFIAWNSQSDDEAETFFKKALSLDPTSQQSAVGLGLVCYRKSRYLECIHWMTKSILDPLSESKTAISCIAKVCLNHLDPAVAIQCLESIIERVSEQPALMIALGRLKLKIGDAEGQGLLNQYLLEEDTKT